MNTESPGRAFHRISKLNFELVKLEMICETPDVVAQERQEYHQRLALCLLQIDDVAQAIQLLTNDMHQDRKRHRSYQQIHMYNDPEMNNYLIRLNVAWPDSIHKSQRNDICFLLK